MVVLINRAGDRDRDRGLEFIRQLREKYPEMKILHMSLDAAEGALRMHTDDQIDNLADDRKAESYEICKENVGTMLSIIMGGPTMLASPKGLLVAVNALIYTACTIIQERIDDDEKQARCSDGEGCGS